MDSFHIRFYRYLYAEEDIEDLLQVDVRGRSFSRRTYRNTSAVTFDGRVRARAFTGEAAQISARLFRE